MWFQKEQQKFSFGDSLVDFHRKSSSTSTYLKWFRYGGNKQLERIDFTQNISCAVSIFWALGCTIFSQALSKMFSLTLIILAFHFLVRISKCDNFVSSSMLGMRNFPYIYNTLPASSSFFVDSFSCPAYTISAPSTYINCVFTVCGATTITVSVCSSFSGDTELWMYDSSGNYVVGNDDSDCGRGSQFTYSLPASDISGCLWYSLKQGCYGTNLCSGTSAITSNSGIIYYGSISTYPSFVPSLSPSLVPTFGPTTAPTVYLYPVMQGRWYDNIIYLFFPTIMQQDVHH